MYRTTQYKCFSLYRTKQYVARGIIAAPARFARSRGKKFKKERKKERKKEINKERMKVKRERKKEESIYTHNSISIFIFILYNFHVFWN